MLARVCLAMVLRKQLALSVALPLGHHGHVQLSQHIHVHHLLAEPI